MRNNHIAYSVVIENELVYTFSIPPGGGGLARCTVTSLRNPWRQYGGYPTQWGALVEYRQTKRTGWFWTPGTPTFSDEFRAWAKDWASQYYKNTAWCRP